MRLQQGNTDRDWESFAQTDPYWSVLSANEFHRDQLTPAHLDRFFQSGEEHVSSILKDLTRLFGAPAKFDVSLDFGCGVGRLLLPLAAVSKKAIGLDVSPTMLNLCRQHAQERQIQNVEMFLSDDELTQVAGLGGAVDLITSFIVFQHIPPARGCRILNGLLRLLKPGGVGCLHFTFAATIESIQFESCNVTGALYSYYQRTSDGLSKLVEHSPGDRQVQMNHYNLNEIFCYFYQNSISDISVRFTNHSNCIGAEVFFRKPIAPIHG